MIDPKAFGQELAGIIKAQLSPVIARLDAMEKRIDALPQPRDGKDADPDVVAGMVKDRISGELAEIRTAVEAIVIPDLPELPDIPMLVAEAVAEAAKAIPAPKDGKPGESVTLDDVRPVIEDAVSRAVSALPLAKDGVGLAGAIIDRDGNLVVTLTNGEAKTLGPVVGDDGKPGLHGLGFEDMDFETDEFGRVTVRFARGDMVKAVRLPGFVDRGAYRAGAAYLKGDAVSYGGSLWIAQTDTAEKPDGGKSWRLAVKKGRDSRNG